MPLYFSQAPQRTAVTSLHPPRQGQSGCLGMLLCQPSFREIREESLGPHAQVIASHQGPVETVHFHRRLAVWKPASQSQVGVLQGPLGTTVSDDQICLHDFASWEIDRQNMEQQRILFSVDSACGHEIKRCLLLGVKAVMKPRQLIKKQGRYFD